MCISVGTHVMYWRVCVLVRTGTGGTGVLVLVLEWYWYWSGTGMCNCTGLVPYAACCLLPVACDGWLIKDQKSK